MLYYWKLAYLLSCDQFNSLIWLVHNSSIVYAMLSTKQLAFVNMSTSLPKTLNLS